MEMTLIYTVIGFALAGYSVIANDSIQTLGTFIASKKKWFKWYVLAGSASAVMILALGCGSRDFKELWFTLPFCGFLDFSFCSD